MNTSIPRAPARSICTGSVNHVLPGALIAGMFVLTSVAFSSLSDREVLLLKLDAAALEPGGESIDAPTIVRSTSQASAYPVVARPVLPREVAVRNGVRMLNSASHSDALERVTLRMDAGSAKVNSERQIESCRALLRILSRRREPLELRITLRVAPAELPAAIKIAAELSKDGSAPAPVIVVSADSRPEGDSFFVDVCRAGRPENTEVVTR